MDQWIYRKLGVFPEGMKQQAPSPCHAACKRMPPTAAQGILAHGILPVSPAQ